MSTEAVVTRPLAKWFAILLRTYHKRDKEGHAVYRERRAHPALGGGSDHFVRQGAAQRRRSAHPPERGRRSGDIRDGVPRLRRHAARDDNVTMPPQAHGKSGTRLLIYPP